MLKKLATAFLAAAFGLAIYSPAASACPGMDDTKVADKEKKDTKKKKDQKVADKKKSKTKKKAKAKKKEGKKVSRR